MIVLRSPKGWTGPQEVGGLAAEGTFRSHQVPLAGLAENPEHLKALEAWLRSYRADELFKFSKSTCPGDFLEIELNRSLSDLLVVEDGAVHCALHGLTNPSR